MKIRVAVTTGDLAVGMQRRYIWIRHIETQVSRMNDQVPRIDRSGWKLKEFYPSSNSLCYPLVLQGIE